MFLQKRINDKILKIICYGEGRKKECKWLFQLFQEQAASPKNTRCGWVRVTGSSRLTDLGESLVMTSRRGSDPHTGRAEARLHRYMSSKTKNIPWEKLSNRPCMPAAMYTVSNQARRPWLPASIQDCLISSILMELRDLDCLPAHLPVGQVPTVI